MRPKNAATQQLCIWAGPLMLFMFALGFMVLAGYLPPPSAELTPRQLVHRLSEHTDLFRLGMLVTMAGFALMVPWAVGIAARVQLSEGSVPVLTYVQLGSVAIGSLIGQFATWIFEAATYRLHDTSPMIIRTLHDLGWFTFLAPWPSFTVWCLAQGIAILRDDRAVPGMPRWSGYLSIWTGLLFLPACLIFWFKHGPFSWNGLVAFYIPVFIFFIWVVGMTVPALRSLRTDREEEAAVARPPAGPAPLISAGTHA
jgi:hypothetical protein